MMIMIISHYISSIYNTINLHSLPMRNSQMRYLWITLWGAVGTANGISDRSRHPAGNRSTTYGADGGGARALHNGLFIERGVYPSLQTARSEKTIRKCNDDPQSLSDVEVDYYRGKWTFTYFGTSWDRAPFARSGSNADWELPLLSCRLIRVSNYSVRLQKTNSKPPVLNSMESYKPTQEG